MSNGTNDNPPFWPTWRSGHDYTGHAPNTSNDSNRIEPVFRHSVSHQATADASRGSRDPWQMPNQRVVTRPFSFSGFPDHQRASTPVQIVWLEDAPARAVNPRFLGPLPRFTTVQQHVRLPATPTRQEDFRSSNQEEENNVLSKLRKEIYNPIPKQMTRRLSSYYRDQNRTNYSEKGKEKDDDGRSCAICLEDFEPREQVMLTPCDHMFHEECILPWAKSNGQCPVCRFVLSERIRQTASSTSNNNVSNVSPADLFAGELFSIIRAMEEVFLWGNSH